MPQSSPHGATASSKVPTTPSPSYFGAGVSNTSKPSVLTPGRQARPTWNYPCPAAADSSTTKPVDADPDFDTLRRHSGQGQGNKSVENSSPTDQSGDSTRFPPNSHMGRSSRGVAKSSGPAGQPEGLTRQISKRGKDGGRSASIHGSFFDIPRHESPTPLSPDKSAATNHRNSRLSLPANNLHTPPPDPSFRQAQRADTLPGNPGQDVPALVSPQQFVTLLQNSPDQVLLLDLRVAPQYSISRISGALNLCIPTTLLKRPSFGTQKLRDTFAGDYDRDRFSRWKTCNHIALYDSSSNNLKDAQTAIHVLKKFSSDGWAGRGIILKGGFAELSCRHPSMVEQVAVDAVSHPATSPLSLASPRQIAAPVAGGCPMPTSKAATVPFFNNIRQNMDLLDGVGQLPVSHPPEMSMLSDTVHPRWLKKAVAERDAGKLVSDKFLAIERTEQKRMQDALDCPGGSGSPQTEGRCKVQIAGIEKGAQNRYNNIFPYDHSRVHLESVPAGGSDYINANHIKASYTNKRYIATQAPVPATFADFWRLIWEQDVRVIVMLTAESEGGQLKSHPYWHSGEYDSLKLNLLSEHGTPLEPEIEKLPTLEESSLAYSNSLGDVSQAPGTKQNPSLVPSATVRRFTLSHSKFPFEPMREITQLQYSNWPDFGAPAQPYHLLALTEQTERYARASAARRTQVLPSGEPAPKGQRPVLVHCSAGCGRTGTFCTVDSVVDMLKRQKSEGGDLDRMETDCTDDVHASEWLNHDDVDLIAQTVGEFRGQRLSMVQNLRQFVLCYESVLDWLVRDQSRDEHSVYKNGNACG